MHPVNLYEWKPLLPVQRALSLLLHSQLFLVAFVSCFLVLFMVYQFMVYVPLVYTTNTEITNERFVVLLLPPAILKAVPSLQALVQDMLNSADNRFNVAK
jgi:hypothetical protein